MPLSKVAATKILKIKNGKQHPQPDLLAVEEPLEIRLGFGPLHQRQEKNLAITMRTPGHDFELALGFLMSESIIQSNQDILSIKYCPNQSPQSTYENSVRVELQPDVPIDFEKLNRHFYTSSSCGVCGKASLDSIQATGCAPLPSFSFKISSDLISQLPSKLRLAQAVFEHTGGLHASALFDQDGSLLQLREDIGRHNAMDKIIGWAAFHNQIPLGLHLILVSGRLSFEVVQKALLAGVPILAAIGAPSSLAVQLAQEFQLTLIGFVRPDSYNIYSCPERIL